MRTSRWTNRTSPSGPKASISLCSEPAQGSVGKLAVGCSFTKRSPLLPADPPPKMCPSQVLGRLLTVRAVVVFLTLVMVTSVLLQAILCKSPALTWLGLSPRPGVLPLSDGLSRLWLFHVSCFLLLPCAVRELAVRPAASPSFPIPGRFSSLGSACLCSKVCSFVPRKSSSHLHPGSLFSFLSNLCVPLIQSLVVNPQK